MRFRLTVLLNIQDSQEKNNDSKNGKDTEKWLIENGVDINDVWFVAVAWEHNIIAVTSDKMEWIKKAVGGNVTFENWLESPSNKLMELIEGKS